MTATVLHYAAFTDAGSSDSGPSGNPAGVVLDASSLSDADRLALAAELGYAESAFISPTSTPGTFHARYWSPLAEVDFCGHATVAAAVALAERDGPGPLVFDTQVGPIDVLTAAVDGVVTATLTSVPTSTTPVAPAVLESALAALDWSAGDLDPAYPPHVAYGGVHHLILVASSRTRLARLEYDFDALGALMAEQGWTTVDLLWADRVGADRVGADRVGAEAPDVFHARNPFPPGGHYEDPATGAAAAAFGGYLRSLGLVTPPARVTVLQGEDMGRPSRLLIDISASDDRIRVTGAASPI